MSKRLDRARAESGMIFRDGMLWKREDWEKLHPRIPIHSPLFPFGTRAPEEEEPQPAPYFCPKCNRTHRIGTKIYEAHKGEIA